MAKDNRILREKLSQIIELAEKMTTPELLPYMKYLSIHGAAFEQLQELAKIDHSIEKLIKRIEVVEKRAGAYMKKQME